MIENQLADAASAFAALKQMSPTARNMALASIFDERATLAGEVERVAAENAELRATIERVRHELELSEDRTDDYDAGVSTGMKAVLGRIRRAIEGPAT